MNFEFELLNEPRDTWDKEILDFEFPEICQTSFFGKFIQESGKSCGYVSIYENGDLVGNCLIEISNEKIATWFYGPLIKSGFIIHQDEIINQLLIFLKKNRVIAIENSKTQKLYSPRTSINEKSNLYSSIGNSPFINILPETEELLLTFDRSVRKNIKKCERAGVEIVISENSTLIDPYLEMLSRFRSTRHMGMPSLFPNHETMVLFNSPITSMGIALAKFDGQFLAGLGFVTIGQVMTEIAMATSNEYETTKLPVNEYLKVKAIEFYKLKGIKLYDLTGGDRNPTDIKKRNIAIFKQKFASDYAIYGMIDRKILSANWYPFAIRRKIKYFFSK